MKIEFIGGCNVVGGNSVLLSSKTTLMLDYGVRINPAPPVYPPLVKTDNMILSHAHLDHCGGLPRLYVSATPKCYMTSVSTDLVKLLLEDSMKIADKENYPVPFKQKHVRALYDNMYAEEYYNEFRLGEYKCILYDAGHIPGSAGILVNADKKKIFYTGDINNKPTHLVNSCHLPKDIDILIMESTYSKREHPLRLQEEKNLIALVEEVVNKNSTALLPVFAIGRSQEVLFILEKFTSKIAIDGMARKATEIIFEHSSSIKDHVRLRKILNRIFTIHDSKDREFALKNYPIIISTAGMLFGGPALYFLKKIRSDPESKVLFTGYLIDDSPGKELLDTGRFKGEQESYNVKCEVRRFDLSSHAGHSGLLEIIKKTNPQKVACIHGDDCEGFAKEIESSLGISAFAPKAGEKIKV